MAVRKIEVNEDDLKKVILMLKLSRPHLQIPSEDLALQNLWRVSDKLADKLMKKAELVMVTNKGRTTLKQIGEVTEETTTENPVEEKPEVENPIDEAPQTKVPRCRKRKK